MVNIEGCAQGRTCNGCSQSVIVKHFPFFFFFLSNMMVSLLEYWNTHSLFFPQCYI